MPIFQHECDRACVCPVCGGRQFYNPDTAEHACANAFCAVIVVRGYVQPPGWKRESA